MQRVTNRLGLFRLGNGSSFTAASSRDTQRAFRDLQSALRSAETECKDSRSYFADCIFFFFFGMVGSCSRTVWCGGLVNAWGRREQCHLYEHPVNLENKLYR